MMIKMSKKKHRTSSVKKSEAGGLGSQKGSGAELVLPTKKGRTELFRRKR